jgi:type VI protein secretion system component Hcp
MPVSGAEIYLLAMRKSMVPVVGEAVPHPFDEQIELDGWDWTLVSELARHKLWEEEQAAAAVAKAKKAAELAQKAKEEGKPPSIDFDRLKKEDQEILKAIAEIQKNERKTQVVRNKEVLDKLKDAQASRISQLQDGEEGGEKGEKYEALKDPYHFKFSKNVDLATTQLLNSMKAGEVFPRMVLTVIHRAKHAPLTLIVQFTNVRLLKYELKNNVTETMSDMTEEWEARFDEMDYAYQNRPGSGGVNLVTQGTSRVFKMGLSKLL